MKTLIKHILNLLQQHDCVVVPDLGGFIMCEASADLRKDIYTFTPPCRTLRFNPELRHNDGLLQGEYMEAFGITYRDATLRVENAAAQLLQELKEQQELTLYEIGTLKLNKEGAVEFYPCNSKILNATYYGLPETKILPYNQLKKESDRSTSQSFIDNLDTIHISKQLLRGIVSIAAIATLIVCISFPVNIGNELPLLNAGMIPTIPATVENITSENKDNQTKQPTETVIKEEPLSQQTKKAQPKPTQITTSTFHYIIVGSFPDEKMAKKELNKLINKGVSSSGIVTRNGRSRLYAAKFATKQEAETKLSFYKKQLNCSDAWIFSSK